MNDLLAEATRMWRKHTMVFYFFTKVNGSLAALSILIRGVPIFLYLTVSFKAF